MIHKKSSKGFTLIELLVVISIIGVLASIVLAALTSTKVKASDAKKISTVRQVDTALKLYESNVGSAPGNFLDLNGDLSNDALLPEDALIACEDSSNPESDENLAYVKSMQQLLDAGVYPEIPRSADGNSYCYFDYGGLFAEGALFTAKLAKGDTWTTAPSGVPAGGQPPVTPSFAATGGNSVVDIGGKRIHTFTESGTFDVSAGRADIEVLVVAGGGGGGANMGGGGGAGGLITSTITVTPRTYSVVVGSGGAGGTGDTSCTTVYGRDGTDSSFDSTVANGGGGGGGYVYNSPGCWAGRNGGSGGGASGDFVSVGMSTSGQGNNGGRGASGQGNLGGGGGGRGSVGVAAIYSRVGNGGNGIQFSVSGAYYAGGGGGGGRAADCGNVNSVGGSGGGGFGSCSSTNGGNGENGTGGGGGGGSNYRNGGNGGSGIVIISYDIPE